MDERNDPETTKKWIRREGYPHAFINKVSYLLYGQPVIEAISTLHHAHMTPHGTTAFAARKELKRTLCNIDQIADVLIATWDDLN